MENDKASPAEIQKHLKGVDYPAQKHELVRHAQGQNGPENVISVLRRIDEKEYGSPADVMKSVGKVE